MSKTQAVSLLVGQNLRHDTALFTNISDKIKKT